VTKTNALESLVIASFVRGLSDGDIEATLADALGDRAAISKSTVSSVCEQIKGEYDAWARRRLDEVTLDYLFLDASFFRMHPRSPPELVLAAWGITTSGKPAFIGLAPGPGESAGAWQAFLTDLKARGLAANHRPLSLYWTALDVCAYGNRGVQLAGSASPAARSRAGGLAAGDRRARDLTVTAGTPPSARSPVPARAAAARSSGHPGS